MNCELIIPSVPEATTKLTRQQAICRDNPEIMTYSQLIEFIKFDSEVLENLYNSVIEKYNNEYHYEYSYVPHTITEIVDSILSIFGDYSYLNGCVCGGVCSYNYYHICFRKLMEIKKLYDSIHLNLESNSIETLREIYTKIGKNLFKFDILYKKLYNINL